MTCERIDPVAFRHACSKFATGIAVTTLCGDDGKPHGMTINSFASVSLKPPLVLVCIDLGAAMIPLFRSGRHFGINVLCAEQKDISARFAKKGEDRFEGIAWLTGATEVPIIRDSLATYECVITRIVEAGDHIIVIGEVLHFEYRDAQPLVFFNSHYTNLA
jgi:flavin reductase (DIM6/NTAB) family NADH-FMN oxidoreductase RutF